MCRRASPNLHFATLLDVRRAQSLQRVARAQGNSHSTTCLSDTHDLRKRLLRAKKTRTSPHHMFAHPTRAISAEGCPRTNKTCISPHVWASDTPQRVTFRKPPPGRPCRQREVEELEKSDFAGVHVQFDHLKGKLVELLCGNSGVTISVQMTLQEFCRSSVRSGSPARQLLCK